MRLPLEERKYASYAELHRLVEERFDIDHSLARGGTRLIVVDTITVDGHLRVECEDKDGDSYVEEAIWMYLYENNGDYHNAFDGDRFKRLFMPG